MVKADLIAKVAEIGITKKQAGEVVDAFVDAIKDALAKGDKVLLRGSPPLGVCTICVGKKEIGWQHHFGVVRPLDGADNIYRGD